MNPSGPDTPVEEPEVVRVPHGAPSAPGPPARWPLTRRRRAAAFAVAVFADLLQWVAFPLLGGGLAPWANGIDVAVAVIEIALVGWHWAFLPTFVVELAPVVDLVPTWTLAVWIATRGRKE